METTYPARFALRVYHTVKVVFLSLPPIASPQLPGCQMEWLRLFVDFLLPACYSFSTGELPESLNRKACFVAPEQFVAVVQKHRKGGNSRTRLSGAGRLISSVSAGFPSMHQVSPITWSQASLMRICRQSRTRHVNL